MPDCALRVRAGETAFDPTWALDVAERAGRYPAVPVFAGSPGQIWLRVLDESRVTLPTPADYETMDTTPAWQWHLLDVESDGPAVRNDDRPPSTCSSLAFVTDGRSFISDESPDYSKSTLVEATADGFVTHATVRGLIGNIARIR